MQALNGQVLDTVLLLNIILQVTKTPEGAAFTAADVDSNGIINISVRCSAQDSGDGGVCHDLVRGWQRMQCLQDIIIVVEVAVNFE